MGGLLARILNCIYSMHSMESRSRGTLIPENKYDVDLNYVKKMNVNRTDQENHCSEHIRISIGSHSKELEQNDKNFVITNKRNIPQNESKESNPIQFLDLDCNEFDDDPTLQMTDEPFTQSESDAIAAELQLPERKNRYHWTNKSPETLTDLSHCQQYIGGNEDCIVAYDHMFNIKHSSIIGTCRGEIEPLTNHFLSGTVVGTAKESSNIVQQKDMNENTNVMRSYHECSFTKAVSKSTSTTDELELDQVKAYDQCNRVLVSTSADKKFVTPLASANCVDTVDGMTEKRTMLKSKEYIKECRLPGSNEQNVHTSFENPVRTFPVAGIISPKCTTTLSNDLDVEDTSCRDIQAKTDHNELKIASSESFRKKSMMHKKERPKCPDIAMLRKRTKRLSRKRRMKAKYKQIPSSIDANIIQYPIDNGKEIQIDTEVKQQIMETDCPISAELKDMKEIAILHYRHTTDKKETYSLCDLKGYNNDEELLKVAFQSISNTVLPTSLHTSSEAYPILEGEEAAETRNTIDFTNNWNRLHTFRLYAGHGSSVNLARGGFVCEQGSDTRCHACNVTYSNWEFLENVDDRHRRLSPNCPMIPPVNETSNNNVVSTLPVNLNRPISGSTSENGRNQQNQFAEQNSKAYEHQTTVLQPNGASLRPTASAISENRQRRNQAYQETQDEITLFLGGLHGRTSSGNDAYRGRGHEPEFLDTGQTMPANTSTRQSSHDHTARDAAQRSLEERRRENRELRDMLICKQCKRNEANLLFQPCCHLSLCETCAENIRKCPVCGLDVDTKKKVFRS